MVNTIPPREQLDMDQYKIVEESGHHEPNSQRGFGAGCGCTGVTRGDNAYRDVVAKSVGDGAEWGKIRFYHQSPVVKVDYGVKWVVDSHGYGGSSTTRERINGELPRGFRLVQRSYEVRLKLPNGGMVDVPDRFVIDYQDNKVLDGDGGLICDYEP